MPRETIHGDGGVTVDVEVAWGANSDYVQVGSVHTEGQAAGFIIINEWLKSVGMPVIDVEQLRLKLEQTAETRGVFTTPHGWHATFENRRAINRMIDVLRRARDHAFGKDA